MLRLLSLSLSLALSSFHYLVYRTGLVFLITFHQNCSFGYSNRAGIFFHTLFNAHKEPKNYFDIFEHLSLTFKCLNVISLDRKDHCDVCIHLALFYLN